MQRGQLKQRSADYRRCSIDSTLVAIASILPRLSVRCIARRSELTEAAKRLEQRMESFADISLSRCSSLLPIFPRTTSRGLLSPTKQRRSFHGGYGRLCEVEVIEDVVSTDVSSSQLCLRSVLMKTVLIFRSMADDSDKVA